MKITYESKGDFKKTEKWLSGISDGTSTNILRGIAQEGTQSLSSNTPRDTGITASGWRDEVRVTKDGIEIAWINVAHPEASVSIAKIIDIGHGTRNGGYVPPRPYIKSAMRPVWDNVDKLIKEMINSG